ncbi:ankyrin repeat domain-containing protein 27 [Plakobranchus ocellatus]|uniref:Ankyrin repeat domain-containing protein 27 n=1 Tax=Plakobranchus ocellatus TaxID=259542 RepID=A0AAV4DFT3_9GAST|nr:ankyrin repeat domain-containing protein 27 [Plakobranchus ocellatus]
MASEIDELEINPFYNALQTKYVDMYERAQECCYILCIPQSQSLNPRLISPGFVETHILRPSPYFKGQYMTTHSANSKTLKLSDDGQYFTTLQGFYDERTIRVLSEELAYNKDYKQYKVLIIERPFDPKYEKVPDTDSVSHKQQMHTPKITPSECREFLKCFSEHREELLRLDNSIDYFCRHYMVLPDYLDDAVARLEDISSLALADIVKNLKFPFNADSKFIEILAGTLESYMMDAVYYKVFPVVRQRFSKDDQLLLSKCHKLNKVNPQEIGVKEEFSCPLPMADGEFDAAIALVGETDVPKRKRAKWSKEWFLQLSKSGHTKLLLELSHNEPSDFKNFLRMDIESYNELLQMVEPLIVKQTTNMRQPISPAERLSITLRYLATGNTFEDLKFVSAIAPQTIGKIVIETCEAIISCLHDYIKMPQSEDDWLKISEGFRKSWNFPHALGAIDGKHVAIIKPPGSGSYFYNYKKFFSIVLMAVVDANYEFIVADVGVTEECRIEV